MAELVGLSLLGGLLALDGTSVGQFMVSRPLVAGFLTGLAAGDPALGFAVGALLEVYLLVEFPVGGARFPEGATATVIAVSTAIAAPGPGGLALGVAVGLVWGQLGGFSVSALRIANGRLAPDPAGEVTTPARVEGAHLASLGLDLLRGTLVTLTGLLVGRVVVEALADSWPLDQGTTRGLLLLGGVVSLGILLRSYGGFARRAGLFFAGLAVGALGGWLL